MSTVAERKRAEAVRKAAAANKSQANKNAKTGLVGVGGRLGLNTKAKPTALSFYKQLLKKRVTPTPMPKYK